MQNQREPKTAAIQTATEEPSALQTDVFDPYNIFRLAQKPADMFYFEKFKSLKILISSVIFLQAAVKHLFSSFYFFPTGSRNFPQFSPLLAQTVTVF